MRIEKKVIRFKQEAWLKPYTGMNTELRKNMILKNNMENIRKHY